jgi:hypothetical protein
MRRVAILASVLLILPTAAFAKGECKEDKTKFCKGVEAKEKGACLEKHKDELSQACKTLTEAREKKREEKKAAKANKDENKPTEADHGPAGTGETGKAGQTQVPDNSTSKSQ